MTDTHDVTPLPVAIVTDPSQDTTSITFRRDLPLTRESLLHIKSHCLTEFRSGACRNRFKHFADAPEAQIAMAVEFVGGEAHHIKTVLDLVLCGGMLSFGYEGAATREEGKTEIAELKKSVSELTTRVGNLEEDLAKAEEKNRSMRVMVGEAILASRDVVHDALGRLKNIGEELKKLDD